MLQRLRSAGLLWPILMTLPALAVLIGLGTWQLQRKGWKDGLVAAIKERSVAAPVPLSGRVALLGERAEYLRVRVSGRFLHGQERHRFIGPGWHIITPLVTDDGMIVLVNRGFVPDQLKTPDSRRPGQVSRKVEVIGLVRLPERPGAFTPRNDGARNMWFWRDVEAMAQCWNAAAELEDCRALAGVKGLDGLPKGYPFLIDAAAEPENPGGWPKGGTTNLAIANRHLEYALTWFGLAATLVGVFIVFAAGRVRSAGDT